MRDTETSATPYSCDVLAVDYGVDEPDAILSVDQAVLGGTCPITRAFGYPGDEEVFRIVQPRGQGYYAQITPLDGATITVVSSAGTTGSRDDFEGTSAEPWRVAHNPSYLYEELTITSDTVGARVQVTLERGPIDEDSNTSAIYSIPEIALDTPETGALFAVDNDRVRSAAVAGNLYEVVLTPTEASTDLALRIEDPLSRVSHPAVTSTGGAGVVESLRVLGTSDGHFVVVIEDPRGLVTNPEPLGYTIEVRDLGPEA
jgi:hypothetical protein